MKASPSQHVILSTNYSVEGTEYPAGRPVPRELVRPDHLRDLEVRPGVPSRKVSAGRVGNFIAGVSYPIDEDGLPIRTPETDRAEELAAKAWKEREDESWRHSGLRYSDPETGEFVEPKKPEELR